MSNGSLLYYVILKKLIINLKQTTELKTTEKHPAELTDLIFVDGKTMRLRIDSHPPPTITLLVVVPVEFALSRDSAPLP